VNQLARLERIFGLIISVVLIICVLVTGLIGTLFILNFKEINTLMHVISLIKLEYVESVPMKTLIQGAAFGMVEALEDPYSVYMDPNETDWIYDYVHGVTGGIGVTFITQRDLEDRIVIRSVLKDSPAERAGIQADDAIIEVDGKPLSGISLEEAVGLVRGVPGTAVGLTVLRPGESDPLGFTLTRDEIDVPTSSSDMITDRSAQGHPIGYLALSRFASNTPGMVDDQIEDLLDQGMEGLVLDLRNNPGGDVDSVEKIARHFIPNGVLAQPVSRNSKTEDFTVTDSEILPVPFVILINEDSASASEILAGAVQDYKTGTLVGVKSYGKASIQVIYSLSNGGGLKITIAKYLTPLGRDIGGTGIEPDIVSERNPGSERDDQLDQAVQVLVEQLNAGAEMTRAS
jgi:carboxyl-terminal processing protease